MGNTAFLSWAVVFFFAVVHSLIFNHVYCQSIPYLKFICRALKWNHAIDLVVNTFKFMVKDL